MKVLFVGDNRACVNWGRGASIALHQLLSASFEISACISGELFDLSTSDAGYMRTLMPARYYRHFRYLLSRRSRRPIGWYIRLEEALGARDFISVDPSISVDNLLAQKHRFPALGRIYDQVVAADLVVVDGDGDIIFSTPPRRSTLFLLAMIELGVRLKKPVFLVNSMISDCPSTGRNNQTLALARHLFAQCKAVALRDYESLRYVQKEMPEANAAFIPDSLFSWYSIYSDEHSHPPFNGDFMLSHPESGQSWGKLDFSQPYICIGGGALASHDPDRAVECYGRLVDAISELGYRVYLAENDIPDSFVRRVALEKGIGIVPVDAPILMCGAVLAHARLFISGRYHPSIFASLGGTPCIFLGSHAHKMSSLSEVLEYDEHRQFDALPGDAEIEEIVATAQRYLNQGERCRDRIRQVARTLCTEANELPTFVNRYLHG